MASTNSLSSYYEKFLATGDVKCIDEEIPFEIPNGWEWCRFGSLSFNRDSERIPLSVSERLKLNKKFDYYGASGVIDKVDRFLFDKPLLLIGEDGANLINRSTPIAFIARGKYWVNNHAHVIDFYSDVLMEYICNYINAISLIDHVTGTAQPKMNQEKMNSILVALPPNEEQTRINQKIESILPLVYKYDKQKKSLDNLNNELYHTLHKSILQEAIQGRLVPQLLEEGTAQELLEQIKQEKQQLVKESKLKKSILSDSIIYKGDDNKYYERINAQTVEIELPFEYPNNWSVLRLKDICQLIDGEKKNEKGICLDAKYLRGKSSATIVEKGKFVYAGDNIILVDGENSGEVFTVPQNGYMGSTFKQLWLSSVMWKPYILAFILFYKEELRNSKRGAAIPHLNKGLFYNLLIGIPPLAEQRRIAERINELSQLLK